MTTKYKIKTLSLKQVEILKEQLPRGQGRITNAHVEAYLSDYRAAKNGGESSYKFPEGMYPPEYVEIEAQLIYLDHERGPLLDVAGKETYLYSIPGIVSVSTLEF